MSDLRAGPYTLPIGRIANFYLKNESSGLPQDDITGVLAKGLYRVSLALAITNIDGVLGQLTCNLFSKGDNGVLVTQSLTTINTNAQNIAQDSFVCECDGTSTLQLAVVLTGSQDTLLYSLRGVVEQLSILP